MQNVYCPLNYTAQKMKFSVTDFFSECDQIHSFPQIWSHLLKKSFMENFISCVVLELLKKVNFPNYYKIIIHDCKPLQATCIIIGGYRFFEAPFHINNRIDALKTIIFEKKINEVPLFTRLDKTIRKTSGFKN